MYLMVGRSYSKQSFQSIEDKCQFQEWQPVMGFFNLFLFQGAVIAPSDEDSVTFSVNAANGDLFKLRGLLRLMVVPVNHIQFTG